ncbi:Rof/RNase P-like protein [Scleroderma yunnanense]
MAATSREQKRETIDIYKPLTIGKNQRLVLTSGAPFTPTYVQSQTRVSDPASLYEARVKGRHVALANPVKEKTNEKKKKRPERIKRAEKTLARRNGKKGGWKIEKASERFDLFIPLHRLWMGYMSELLDLPPAPLTSPGGTDSDLSCGIPNSSTLHAKLVKADLHGSILTVRQSRNPCLVGLSGIVLYESENAFRVISKANQTKLIPKQNSIFTLAVPLHSTLTPSFTGTQTPQPTPTHHPSSLPSESNPQSDLTTVLDKPHLEFELYGNQFCFRSAERAGRKFKAKETIEL